MSPASLPVPHLFSGTTLSRPRSPSTPPPKKIPTPVTLKATTAGTKHYFTHIVISLDLEILIKIKIDNAVNDVNTVESAAATP